MKNSIKCLIGLLIITALACNDKPKTKPEPAATADINDLVGTWVTVDSSVCNYNNNFFYLVDSLVITKDSIFQGLNFPILVRRFGCLGKYAFYSAKYFGQDSLILKYRGPTYILTPEGKHKVYFNRTKDTITIIDFRTTYPGCYFNRFYKKNK